MATGISEFKAEENRRTVGEDELGEYLPQAVVAVEEQALLRALWRGLAGIGARPGRICRRSLSARWFDDTEQLMKNLYISESDGATSRSGAAGAGRPRFRLRAASHQGRHHHRLPEHRVLR